MQRHDLERLRELIAGFHATKQIRAWAAEANAATKAEALALLDHAAAQPAPSAAVVLHLTEAQYHVLDQALAARERDLERIASSEPHHVLVVALPTLREVRQAAGLAITSFWASRRTGWRL